MKIVEELGRERGQDQRSERGVLGIRDGPARARSRGEGRVLQAEGTAWAKTWQGSRSLLLRGWKDIPEGWDSMHGGGGQRPSKTGACSETPPCRTPWAAAKEGAVLPKTCGLNTGRCVYAKGRLPTALTGTGCSALWECRAGARAGDTVCDRAGLSSSFCALGCRRRRAEPEDPGQGMW